MRAMGMHGLETMRVIGMDYGRKVGSLNGDKEQKAAGHEFHWAGWGMGGQICAEGLVRLIRILTMQIFISAEENIDANFNS